VTPIVTPTGLFSDKRIMEINSSERKAVFNDSRLTNVSFKRSVFITSGQKTSISVGLMRSNPIGKLCVALSSR
jgi:hypothetical protein